jgi:hypothetical protein
LVSHGRPREVTPTWPLPCFESSTS